MGAEKFDRKKDPYFFETIMCSCGSKTDLKMHKYSDEVKCSECVGIIESIKDRNEEGVREKLR